MNVLPTIDPRIVERVQSLGDLRAERSRRATLIAKKEIARSGRLKLATYVKLGWHVLEPSRPYKHGFHIDAICEHLDAIETAEITRLAIAMPPGCMKSLLCSVFFPTHIWGPGGDPTKRFLGFSHDLKLSMRDALKSRRLILSEWYQNLWGDRFQLVGDQNTKMRYDNNQTGYRVADYRDDVAALAGTQVVRPCPDGREIDCDQRQGE
jgi:hypothetical protein